MAIEETRTFELQGFRLHVQLLGMENERPLYQVALELPGLPASEEHLFSVEWPLATLGARAMIDYLRTLLELGPEAFFARMDQAGLLKDDEDRRDQFGTMTRLYPIAAGLGAQALSLADATLVEEENKEKAGFREAFREAEKERAAAPPSPPPSGGKRAPSPKLERTFDMGPLKMRVRAITKTGRELAFAVEIETEGVREGLALGFTVDPPFLSIAARAMVQNLQIVEKRGVRTFLKEMEEAGKLDPNEDASEAARTATALFQHADKLGRETLLEIDKKLEEEEKKEREESFYAGAEAAFESTEYEKQFEFKTFSILVGRASNGEFAVSVSGPKIQKIVTMLFFVEPALLAMAANVLCLTMLDLLELGVDGYMKRAEEHKRQGKVAREASMVKERESMTDLLEVAQAAGKDNIEQARRELQTAALKELDEMQSRTIEEMEEKAKALRQMAKEVRERKRIV